MNHKEAIQFAVMQLDRFQIDGNPDRILVAKLTLQDASPEESFSIKRMAKRRTAVSKSIRKGKTPMYRKSYRRTLKTAIESSGMSQSELETKADISSKGAIGGYLSGRRKPSTPTLERICKALNISPSSLAHM